LYIPEDRMQEQILKYCLKRRRHHQNIPLSYFVKGIKESPAKAVGMPMIIPEKVAFPPKYSAYLFDDETTMKNETCEGRGSE